MTTVSNSSRSGLVAILATIALLGIALAPASSHAQHVMGPLGSNSEVEVESVPADDEMLPSSPADLLMRFSTYVRLVKLTLKAPDGDPVNIGFRYQPDASRVFLWNLPKLPAADYYTVEWAAIDPGNLMARGSFSFSFGPGARLPSELIPEEEILDPVIVPDFRLIDQQ